MKPYKPKPFKKPSFFQKLFGTKLKENAFVEINNYLANNQIDNVLGVRTRAIQRTLKDVDTLSAQEARRIIPEIGPLEENYVIKE